MEPCSAELERISSGPTSVREPLVATLPPVTIRPVVPGDLRGLDVLLSELDSESRYRRWFSAATNTHRAAAWAAHPQPEQGVGLVATVPAGELVGHAAMISMDADRAEVCFEVAAAWRHHGVAGRLLAQLERCAAERGLTTLVAEVLFDNGDMLAVMREHGPCRERRQGSVIELELPVNPGDESPAELAFHPTGTEASDA